MRRMTLDLKIYLILEHINEEKKFHKIPWGQKYDRLNVNHHQEGSGGRHPRVMEKYRNKRVLANVLCAISRARIYNS